ncbi:hypothetical protein [Aquibacillus halophilus]|nr:hypothetical protein [Aquibacillus halophilus]
MLFKKGDLLTLELEDWYKWYKEPQNYHNAVVAHLKNEGYKVETISVVDNLNSNKISTLFIDGIKYELRAPKIVGPTQTVILKKTKDFDARGKK